jgi:hypothetical protein
MKVKHIPTILAFLFLFVVLVIWVFPEMAQAVGLTIPFGGKITGVTLCDNGWLITVGPPRPGIFLYELGVSRIYMNFTLIPKVNVVGNAIHGGVCVSPPAEPIPAEGTIIGIGTGLLP